MQYQHTSATERRTLPPAVAVSVVAFALRPPVDALLPRPVPTDAAAPTIWLPLVRRTRAPFLGAWALPGGPTEWDETLAGTALRTLRAAAQRDPAHLEQLYSFGGVERSADAQRLVTIAYWAQYGEHEILAEPVAPAGASASAATRAAATAAATAGETATTAAPATAATATDTPAKRRRWDDPEPPRLGDAGGERRAQAAEEFLAQAAGENVAWFTIDALPELAFDHAEIIAHAVDRLRAQTEYAAVAHRFLAREFTLAQLREVTEAILGQAIDPANFRRQALARGGLIDTGELDHGGAHRPAKLYRFRGRDGSAPASRAASD